MNFKKLFPSKYLKAVDLDGDTEVVIDSMSVEVVGQGHDAEEKPVLYFHGKEQGLVLNVTNGNFIAAIYGEETDRWIGEAIVLYPTEVQFGSKMVDAIRIKAPPQNEAAPAGVAAEAETPF